MHAIHFKSSVFSYIFLTNKIELSCSVIPAWLSARMMRFCCEILKTDLFAIQEKFTDVSVPSTVARQRIRVVRRSKITLEIPTSSILIDGNRKIRRVKFLASFNSKG
ncbi:hypothetical protein [Psittacid alphaherpesvirus 5]|uniref:Uncharacterized protein n=1 Tax=Psittacid alphaherpesvirus 5 TaxID=2972693 RepID=A0A5P9JPB8_9ALPH|nr:hypothetical protein QKU09_gp73 [Psittacid alphaherpesvirus 5]QFU14617.1 hypothetical protein [Psittacid alphaherpesvirus 5]UOO01088.1 hypothetical protein [Psittacid alphaherpesvirus 5]